MAVFFNDTFTEGSYPLALSSHTSDSGHTWSVYGGSGTPNLYAAQGGVVAAGATAITLWKASAVSGTSADVKATASVYLDTVTAYTQWGIAARINATNNAGYWAFYNRTNGFWRLVRLSSSAFGGTDLADSAAQTYTAASTISVELIVTGSGATVTIELKVNGVSLITTNDTSGSRITAAGRVGFSTHAGGAGFGWFLSSLSADDVVSAGDVTAPVLTSPTGAATGETTASGSVSTDTAEGTLYRVTTTNATETAATVKAGASQAVTATGVQSITATGLAASTAYYHHFVHRDVAGNDSTVSTSAQFTTDAPAVVGIDLSNASLHVLKNNAGTVYASAAFRCVILNASTGAFVAVKTGTTTAGGLIGVLTDAALVAATVYYVIVEPGAGGAYGVFKAAAA